MGKYQDGDCCSNSSNDLTRIDVLLNDVLAFRASASARAPSSVRWRRRCLSATCRAWPRAFLSAWGLQFPDDDDEPAVKLRQCEIRPRGRQWAARLPPPSSPSVVESSSRPMVVGAQRSCWWLFHFQRAVFWPDRTRDLAPHPRKTVSWSHRPRTAPAISTARKFAITPGRVSPSAPTRCSQSQFSPASTPRLD